MMNLFAKAAIGAALAVVGCVVVHRVVTKTYYTVEDEVEVQADGTVETVKTKKEVTFKEKVSEKCMKVLTWTVNNMDKVQVISAVLGAATMVFEIAYELYSWKTMGQMKKDIQFCKDMSVVNGYTISNAWIDTTALIVDPERRVSVAKNLPAMERGLETLNKMSDSYWINNDNFIVHG